MYIMKSNIINVIVAVVIFLIIASALLSSCTVVSPYSEDSIFSKQYKYEGFGDYSSATAQSNSDSPSMSHSIATNATECKKIYGFDGLFCKPYVADGKLDPFGDAEANASCKGKSSGLANSKGYLCLNEKQISLLSTRGGNATGKEFEIGK
jgi:hypothetical protein